MKSRPVLLIGASCRAAAQALYRLGVETNAWDLFADRDTRLVCDTRQIETLTPKGSAGILELDRSLLLPCGGIENSPRLWSELSRKHCVLGPSSEQLIKLRDPFWLNTFCNSMSSSVVLPEIRSGLDSLDKDKVWIAKNLKSAGGLSVRYLEEHDVLLDNEYGQVFISGIEIGVTVRCTAEERKILTVTVPIERKMHDPKQEHDFYYAGSIGPITLPTTIAQRVEQFFDRLCRSLQFIGVLQADLILRGDEIYLLEINPRWTAGMEIAEMISPGKILTQFVSQDGNRPTVEIIAESETHLSSNAFVVKQIIYAKRPFTVTAEYSDYLLGQTSWNAIDKALTSDKPNNASDCLPLHYRLADISESGSKIEKGYPVCTLLISGAIKSGTNLTLDSTESLQWLEKVADRLNPLEQFENLTN